MITNTSTKLVAGLSNHDARALAPDMRQSPEWLMGMKKDAKQSEFACFIRNHTPAAVRLSIPFGIVESAPKMTKEAHHAFLQKNRERYGTKEASIIPTPTSAHDGEAPSPTIIQPSATKASPPTIPDDFDPTKPAPR